MEWLTTIRAVIDYIESHIKDNISVGEIAEAVYMSPFFLERGFSVMTGYTIGEYIRNRKMYLAGIELQQTKKKVIDIALDYGYETPESFTKAFTRFHNATPTEVRRGVPLKTFLPLTINIVIQGGKEMNYKITPLFPFKVIGFERVFNMETAHQEIPKFWDEICEKYCYPRIYKGLPAENAYEQAIMDNCIGEYGVCIDDLGDQKFRYLIAGKYTGGEIPEGMVVYEFPRNLWAIFDCVGPNPETLQAINTKIFKEWLPGNQEYEICGNANIEWYDCTGDMRDSDYHSQIWIPVRKKTN